MPNTIKLKSYGNVVIERVANAVITPGQLIELMSTNKVRKHATSDGDALKMFALEDELQGKKYTEDYAAADQVQCWIPGRGDVVYAILADVENVVIGDFLTSNGDGSLKKHDVVASAAEEAPVHDGITITRVAFDTQGQVINLKFLDGKLVE